MNNYQKKFLSNTCIIREDVLNMKNIKNVCTQIDISEENKHLNFASYFQNISIIAAPILLNVSKYKNIYQVTHNLSDSICNCIIVFIFTGMS
ncbi:hypothetical protein NQ314_002333 [Rhamnusium bicolor]|uniref:Uncharacterized protein n=1 Tax=Rhamnusium bicolor TaxID=1586634 RepID=A0AAV8ZQF1_9CUCU|nr:hypothetical protein NQ314_002333 [Rhamnusium bicolor]